MDYITIFQTAGTETLRIAGSEEALDPRATADLAYQCEVPHAAPLLERLEGLLASARVPDTEATYECPLSLATRAIDIAVEELWPTRKTRCSECWESFAIPWSERRHMYLNCPRCRAVLLNPGWDTA